MSGIGVPRMGRGTAAFVSNIDWIERAACGDADPELFVWDGAAPVSNLLRAASYCASCPVKAMCSLDADAESFVGVWGGVLRSRGRRVDLVEHLGDVEWWNTWKFNNHGGIRLVNDLPAPDPDLTDELAS